MKKILSDVLITILFFVFSYSNLLAQEYKILESDENHIKLEFDFTDKFEVNDIYIDGIKFTTIKDLNFPLQKPGDPFLPTRSYQIGIPQNKNAIINILSIDREVLKDKFVISTPDSVNQPFKLLSYNQNVYGTNALFPLDQAHISSEAIYRYIKTALLYVAPFQFNPVERTIVFNRKILIRIDYKQDLNFKDILIPISDKMTEEYINSAVVNSKESLSFLGKTQSISDSPQEKYWYDPYKNYFKIFLNKKGIYRLTYEQLINSGISPTSGIQEGKLELYNDGTSLPIDVVDLQHDGLFNSGDYIQFMGKPATPHDQFTRMNIYNTTNVYWFSYQADTVYSYKKINGFKPSSAPLITNTIETLTWEEDKEYHKLGYADNDQRDFWYWGSAEARNRLPFRDFIYTIKDSIAYYRVPEKQDVKIRVGLHGLTNTSCETGNGHDATFRFNGKIIGTKQWNGQSEAVFEKSFFVAPYTLGGGDTAQIFSDSQRFEINMFANICDSVQSDYILINYIQFDYWRWNRTYPNYYYFKSPPNDFDENRYYLFGWMRDNIKIYIPSRGEFIDNADIPPLDPNKSVYFIDTINVQTDYFCVAEDFFLSPDSIIQNTASDLRNINNAADYIIITHKNFIPAAERLANYRNNNLHGVTSPRTKVVELSGVFNEFSYGLLDPMALNRFAKYVFENWISPAPQYIVLLGDMSFDYRRIFPTSKENFIPSPPYQAAIYGQAPSDNAIVTVSGDDIVPDIAIGRISCETLEEANLLVDKIINYPADPSKGWKQNVLLLSSGLSAEDEDKMHFNDRNILLENTYLIPAGINATKIFRYPNKTEYIPFQGEGPDIRREIDNGAVIVNYYGHGGGLQWDLVFTNDDILELNNGNKLPFVISVTCYTAHFDNQEIFGEIFNSIRGKGSIAFFGSSGVTFWPTAANLNQELFAEIITNKNYIIGKAINVAKSNQVYGSMIALLTLLGDPAIELAIPYTPDFTVKSSSISIVPVNPVVDDTVTVNLTVENLGRSFTNDSVSVKMFERIISDTTMIGSVSLPNFGESSIISFKWIPKNSGLISLIATINDDKKVFEDDYSDNTAINSFSIFDFGTPNIIKPADGFFSNEDSLEFLIADIGFYFGREFNYIIQLNNSPEFETGSILFQSPILKAIDAVVKWNIGSLVPGEYFWRTIVYDAVDTNSSSIRIFTITDKSGNGYLAQKEQLKLFTSINTNYSDQYGSLVLNTEIKPPYPSPKFLLDSIFFDIPLDQTEASTFTTDGTYFYFGHLPAFTNGAKSKIYKIGTGLNGTIAGFNYGEIPNLEVFIYSQLMFHQGYLYTCTGSIGSLVRIDPAYGDTTSILIQDDLLLTLASLTQIGGVFLYSDGQYVYNLGIGTAVYPDKFVLRKFDPSNNWAKVGDDIVFSGSIMKRIASFIVVKGYLIVYENYFLISLRRYRLSDGAFEEEWAYGQKVKDYYSITYDHINDFVYFNTFRPGETVYTPAFFKYRGTYKEANGEIISPDIGPASKWYNLEFYIDQTNSNGVYRSYLLGKDKITGNWLTLDSLIQPNYDLQSINAKQYNTLKLKFSLADSSFGAGEPMKFNSLKLNYQYLPEISIIPRNLTFTPDSMFQGIPLGMSLNINNFGYVAVDSLRIDFYNNLTDTAFYSTYIDILNDSSISLSKKIFSDNLLYTAPVSPIEVKAVIHSPIEEYYTFNNLTTGTFYVIRDSANPIFNITFDGREIVSGDIVSSEPEVIITLEDNSPLPIDSTYFTLVHTFDNIPKILKIPGPDITYNYNPYPNSKASITWKPKLEDGKHILEVLAKDASGNFFDSTSSRSVFNVYNNPDLLQVYNYPNPFKDNTNFTFEIRGVIPPQEFKIKIFTVAGRLIRVINVPTSSLQIGFNKVSWDGRDEDGDEIANGLYFYKIISKQGDQVKTATQKLAKVK